jgi:anti-sigma factor RsiW
VNCSEYKSQIVALINGNLAPEDAARLRGHLAECKDCNGEYEVTDRLVKGLKSVSDEIRENHISSTLLYQFIQSPQSLDADTIDLVRTHLDLCDRCQQDTTGISQLLGIEIEKPPATEEIPSRPTGFWGAIFRKRLVPAFTAAAAVIIILVAWIVSTNDGSLPSVARVISYEEARISGYTVVTLVNDITTRGENESTEMTPTVISRSDARALILTLEAVTFGDEDVSYGVVVTGPDGNPVWQSDVTADQLESGSLWLIADRDDFKRGTYQISVVEQQGDYRATVSTARFEIRP